MFLWKGIVAEYIINEFKSNLKTKLDDLDVGKFKNVPVDKISDAVAKEVVKKQS